MKNLFFTILLLSSVALNVVLLSESRSEGAVPVAPAEVPSPGVDWDAFIEALAWRESGWNPDAVGSRDDVGWLQITPVIVRDANRISGYERFTLEDRRSVARSVEMFNVIQDEYNPGHDLNLSLKIWNPKAPVSYHRDVMRKYRELVAAASI